MKVTKIKLNFLRFVLLCTIVCIAFFSCMNKEEEGVNCTMEYRIISVEVVGVELTDFYTIRLANQDTIRLEEDTIFENYYPILTDSYFSFFETNSVEDFRFIGLVEEEIVVDELYQIGADRCHVFKESGVERIVVSE